MKITVTLQLEDEEQRQLAGILGCSSTNLAACLGLYGAAALEEYVRMFLGQKVFTRGSDVREYRLFLLIKEALEQQIPAEQTVSNLFQTTVTQSRGLIRSVISKYQYDLHEAIWKTLKNTIENATKDENNEHYLLNINSENIVSELNRLLASIDGKSFPIARKQGAISVWELKEDSYNKLRTRLSSTT
ncbi:MAG TPA: hypothetical protein VF703_19785 [Pyrinomonadaceae bacterium]|jgi:hypothetical protein